MDKLDKLLLTNIISLLSPLHIFQSVSIVCKQFHTICTSSSDLWRHIQDEDYLLEYPQEPSRTFQNCSKLARQILKVRRAWRQISPYFIDEQKGKNEQRKKRKQKKEDNDDEGNDSKDRKAETPEQGDVDGGKEDDEGPDTQICQRVQKWMDEYLSEGGKKSKKRQIKLPLHYRLFLREAKGKQFNWRGRELICGIFSEEEVIKQNQLDNTYLECLSLYVAGEGDAWSIIICCDPTKDTFGEVWKYEGWGVIRSSNFFKNWLHWLLHAYKKRHTYDVGDYHSDPDISFTRKRKHVKD